MVVVVLLGILIAIAVPTYRRFQRKAENTQFVNNLRIFTQAYETFAMKYGNWPLSSTNPGDIPEDSAHHSMSGEFRDADWKAGALGGQWKWNLSASPSAHPRASISRVEVTVTEAQMTEIDTLIDDGNPGTGNFRSNGTTYTFTVQN
jgi:type II secretory pathway pseudopilin PulG